MVKIQKISVIPVAKILGALNSLIGLVLGLIAAILSVTGTGQPDDGFLSLGVWSILVFPVVNGGIGFLSGAFLVWSYNSLARWFGGIELEIEEKS